MNIVGRRPRITCGGNMIEEVTRAILTMIWIFRKLTAVNLRQVLVVL